MVSILVLVDVGLRPYLMSAVLLYLTSFNPCFSGCWSATFLLYKCRRCGGFGFNPCFSGCWSATGKNGFIIWWYWVSILVLVDVGLRPDTETDAELYKAGFNPCFSGCWSATSMTRVGIQTSTKFQSLF